MQTAFIYFIIIFHYSTLMQGASNDRGEDEGRPSDDKDDFEWELVNETHNRRFRDLELPRGCITWCLPR